MPGAEAPRSVCATGHRAMGCGERRRGTRARPRPVGLATATATGRRLGSHRALLRYRRRRPPATATATATPVTWPDAPAPRVVLPVVVAGLPAALSAAGVGPGRPALRSGAILLDGLFGSTQGNARTFARSRRCKRALRSMLQSSSSIASMIERTNPNLLGSLGQGHAARLAREPKAIAKTWHLDFC